MQVVGFNFTKISAEKNDNFKAGKISAGIEFIDIEKQKLDILKEGEAARFTFQHKLSYEHKESKEKKAGNKNPAELMFEGKILMSMNKEESKGIFKEWKKKQVPNMVRIFLSNFILRKCASKALNLQEELNLQSHIPLPSLTQDQNKQ